MDNGKVVVFIDGTRYDNISNLNKSSSLFSLAGAVNISMIDDWAGKRLPFGINSTIKIYYDYVLLSTLLPTLLSTCNIKSVERMTTSTGGSIVNISASDKTSELAEVSYVVGESRPSERSGVKFGAYMEALVADFDSFSVGYMPDSLKNQIINDKVNIGTTYYEIIRKLSKKYGFWTVTDAFGDVRFIKNDKDLIQSDVVLKSGENIAGFTYSQNFERRFSDTIAIGQGNITPSKDSKTSNGLENRVNDPTISRYRPTVIVTNDDIDESTLRDLAEKTYKSNGMNSEKVSVTLPESVMIDNNDSLPSIPLPYKVVGLDIEQYGLKGRYVITSVNFGLTQTSLTLVNEFWFKDNAVEASADFLQQLFS